MAVPVPEDAPPLACSPDPEELQDKIIWEFRALDSKRTGKIKPAAALLIFKSVLGSRFSLATWYAFICDRGSSSADVALGEIERFLVAQPPSGHPASFDDYLSTEQELRRKRVQRDFKKYTMMTSGRRESAAAESSQRQSASCEYTVLEQKAEQRVLALEAEGFGAIQGWLNDTPEGSGNNVQVDEKLWEQVYLTSQASSAQRSALEKAVFHGDPFQCPKFERKQVAMDS